MVTVRDLSFHTLMIIVQQSVSSVEEWLFHRLSCLGEAFGVNGSNKWHKSVKSRPIRFH